MLITNMDALAFLINGIAEQKQKSFCIVHTFS